MFYKLIKTFISSESVTSILFSPLFQAILGNIPPPPPPTHAYTHTGCLRLITSLGFNLGPFHNCLGAELTIRPQEPGFSLFHQSRFLGKCVFSLIKVNKMSKIGNILWGKKRRLIYNCNH